MEKTKNTKTIGDILSALTIAVLFLVILLLVVFTARSYQHGVDSQYENDTRRIVCAYVATAVKDHDGGAVEPMDFDGHPGISIADGDTGFTHKIYLSDGQLLEEYSRTDMPVNPQTASKIGETSLFEIQYISDNLLEIKTDKGASYVNVRR
jgi:hypothetical protein